MATKHKSKRVHFNVAQQALLYNVDNSPSALKKESTPYQEFLLSDRLHSNAEYLVVLRDCIEHSLLPLQELPKRYTADKLIKKIERAFGVNAADIRSKLANSGLDYRSIKARFEANVTGVGSHQFYTENSFEDVTRYELWKDQERTRLRKAIAEIEAKLVNAPGNSTPMRPETLSPIEARLNDRVRHEYLCRTFTSSILCSKKQQDKNQKKLAKFFDRLEAHMKTVPDDLPLEVDAFIAQDADASKIKRHLLPLSSWQTWVLQEFESANGIGRLTRYVSVLHFVLSSTNYSRYTLLLTIWLVELAVKELNKRAYNKIELRDFQIAVETLIKEVDHLMLNLFRYFGEDIVGASLVNKMLVQLFDVSKVLKMDIFRDINYQNAILFSLEYSMRNKYADELVSCEEAKEVIRVDPDAYEKLAEKEIESKVEDLTSIPSLTGSKNKNKRTVTPRQLSAMCGRLQESFDNAARYNSIFNQLKLDLQAECKRYFIKLLMEDVKLIVMGRTRDMTCRDMLELCFVLKITRNRFASTFEELQQIGLEEPPLQYLFGTFVAKWSVEALEILKRQINKWMLTQSWNPTVEPEAVQQLFKELKDAHNFVRRVEESKIFSEVTDMKTELRGLIGLAVKYLAEEVYNLFIQTFPADVRGELHQFLLPKASMAENIASASKRVDQGPSSVEERRQALIRSASNPDIKDEADTPDDTEAVVRWYAPSLAVPKKAKKVWKGTPVKLTTAQSAQVSMIKELQRQVVEFNKTYSLVSNLLPVYNMLKDLEVSMLKMLAHTVVVCIREQLSQKIKQPEVKLYSQQQIATMMLLDPASTPTFKEISLSLLQSYCKDYDIDALKEDYDRIVTTATDAADKDLIGRVTQQQGDSKPAPISLLAFSSQSGSKLSNEERALKTAPVSRATSLFSFKEDKKKKSFWK